MPHQFLSRRGLFAQAAATTLIRAQAPGRSASPNIVLLVANELPAWMLACYGNREIRTPNIDLLAGGGVRLTNFYAASPSAPANLATLLTGRTTRQHGVTTSPASLEKEKQLPAILGAAGYRASTDFEHASELFSAGGAPFFLCASLGAPQEPYSGDESAYAGSAFNTLGWEPASPRARHGKEYLKDIPFSLRKYAGSVTALDRRVGDLVRLLDRHGVRGQTLIIFTSATGMLGGRHGLWSSGLGSDPANMYEESVRLPMIWNWPGKTPVQASRSELTGCCDVLPTLCEAAGTSVPAGRNLQGRSFLPIVTGRPFPKKEPWRSLVFANLLDTGMARDTRYKLVIHGQASGELFDLRNDPREKTNQFANPTFLEARERLTRDYHTWMQAFSN